MRQETITYNIYKFSELNLEAQKTAIDKAREDASNMVYEFNLPDQSREIERALESLGFNDARVLYDCSYSQGSGACIEFKSFDVHELTRKALKESYIPHGIASALSRLIDILKPIKAYKGDYHFNAWTSVNSFGTHYCHEKTRYINIEYENYSERESTRDKYDSLIYPDIENEFTSVIQDIGGVIHESLCAGIEYYWNDSAVIEWVNNSDCEFDESGDVYN